MSNPITDQLIEEFSIEHLDRFMRERSSKYKPIKESLAHYDDANCRNGMKIGEIDFGDNEKLIVCDFECSSELSEKSGKKAQYDKAKQILKDVFMDAGLFVFHDRNGAFRFSLVYSNFIGQKRDWSTYRRFTYFVGKSLTNKTFRKRIGEGNFSGMSLVKDAFSVEKVTKEFYEGISYWYFWAVKNCQFPKDAEEEENGRNISVIRLITRMIFIWFMRERQLVPGLLFNEPKVTELLNDFSDNSSSYYHAILQNLFFATLSTKQEERTFRAPTRGAKGVNKDFGNPFVYRFEDYFKDPATIKSLFVDIPFLNGGLFDCLDEPEKGIYVDGFSEVKKNQVNIPNFLFFNNGKKVDLSSEFDTKNKTYPVKGLINLLSEFNFTIDENTTDDKDVALDPELLGRVFENLLASFNPETSTTARKATGSYYTPREIVDYMVDESLKGYLKQHLDDIERIDEKLTRLFDTRDENNPFTAIDSKRIVKLIESVRVVDPAVGSGAFPMGILNRLVLLLQKVDPHNEGWKQEQLDAAEKLTDPRLRQETKDRIEEYFKKTANYGRKLFLIQKCIYGVDIQQIAVEIAKLRFFIALLVDENIDKGKDNWGIEPLPNLDFKIMQGDSLISRFLGVDFDTIDESETKQISIEFDTEYTDLISKYEQAKTEFQNASDKSEKEHLHAIIDDSILQILNFQIQKQQNNYDKAIIEIKKRYASVPKQHDRDRMIENEVKKLNHRYPTDLENIQKQIREFNSRRKIRPFFPWHLFFAEVFSEKGGFDIILGNPPYIQLQSMHEKADILQNLDYQTFTRTGDIYCLFYERGYQLLNKLGLLTLITSNKWMRAGYGEKLRDFLLENTKPLKVIDFSGQKIFESATVDVNILILKKNQDNTLTQGCSITGEDCINNLSVFIEQNQTVNNFKTKQSWTVLQDIEQRIKEKIEEVGVPLKDWDVSINRGILTGYNDAFIITGDKKNKLIAEDPKSAEIIRPILRGRDIKRYGYEYSDLWLLHIPWHFPLHKDESITGASKIAEHEFMTQYLAVYEHLSMYKNQLLSRNKAETGIRYEWYSLQRWGANYSDDFSKQKIIYAETMRVHKNVESDRFPRFGYSSDGIYLDKTCFMITGSNLLYILPILNSKLMNFIIKRNIAVMDTGGFLMQKIYIEHMPIPNANNDIMNKIESLALQIIDNRKNGLKTYQLEDEIDFLVYDLFGFSKKEISFIASEKTVT